MNRLVLALAGLLAIVIAASVIEHLLWPLLPLLIVGIGLLAVYKLMFQRRL